MIAISLEALRGRCRRMRLTIAFALLWPALAAAQPPASGDPFARGAWSLDLSGHAAIEAWNYNISHEDMFGGYTGLTYGVGKGVVLKIGSSLYYVDQRGVDGYLFAGTGGVMFRIYRRPRWSLFVEGEVGISESDTIVPPRGTRFNYLALGTAGVAIRLKPALHLLASMRLIHVSNGGIAGRDRNPDIEAVGPQIGLLVGF
jgi:hypothetical protein